MEHEMGAFQIRSTLQRFSSLVHKCKSFSALWNLKPPKSPTYRKSIRGITKNKTNNMSNRSLPPAPKKSQSFSTEIELPYMLSFLSLANAGELQLCVALSDRLLFFFFLLSKRWTALGQDQIYSQSGFISFFFPFSFPPNGLRKCLSIVP